MSNLLKQIKERGLMAVCDKEMENWQEAVRVAIEPLVDRGDVTENYADDVIANIKEYGPYVCIVPRICIPHAMSPSNVKVSNIAFVKFNKPVNFENDDNKGEQFISTLFFAIAASDPDEHLHNLTLLMEALDNPELIDKLCNASSIEELNAIVDSL